MPAIEALDAVQEAWSDDFPSKTIQLSSLIVNTVREVLDRLDSESSGISH